MIQKTNIPTPVDRKALKIVFQMTLGDCYFAPPLDATSFENDTEHINF
jgi:hypothetical protein